MERVVDVNEDNKHLAVRGGMTSEALSQYFRSFMVKLSMAESSLGEVDIGGTFQGFLARPSLTED